MAASSAAARPRHRRRRPPDVGRGGPERPLEGVPFGGRVCGGPAGAAAARRRSRRAGPAAAPGDTATPVRTAPAAGGSARRPGAGARSAARASRPAPASPAAPARAPPRQVIELPEPFVGEAADRGQRLRRLRPVGDDDELVAAARPQGRDAVEAARADRAAAVGRVRDGDQGVEAGRGAHQQRGRPRVEPMCVAYRHPGGLRGRAGCRASASGLVLTGARLCLAGAGRQVRHLAGEAGAGRGGHSVQRVAEPRGDSRGHGALHERRLREQELAAPLLVQQVDGQLGGEDGASQVHQDQHAVLRPHLLDRPQHPRRVGAERALRRVQPAGAADPHPGTGHLGGELQDAFREPGAVADDDEADHGYPAPPSPASVSAAVRRSSHDDVAPGS